MYQFSTAQELLAMCEREKAGIAEVALRSEMEASGQAREYIWSRMEELYQVMQESIKNGLAPDRKTLGGLIGGNAYKLQQQMQKGCLSGQTVLKAASYALAVTEVNASMGKIIAAPTGGASGTLPGVIAAFIEDRKLGDEMAVQALLVGAAIGKIIASQATLSGAEGGCQAECGSAAAMAAAAVVYLAGGTAEMSVDAAAMALKGLLGLVCDPVAGLVEVPCSKRNAIGTAHAVLCADMALAGITSYIPFDEVVEAMSRVGRMMSPDLRETARGGCAATPTARAYVLKMNQLRTEQ
ncbi:MAG TPA: L-serine ammonia-lyase, iron-sulfur-dependent, subunit alpha [Syntrophomonas sp.]|nr:L-serine ammonia-lyase, iron-sulfur-dependent, subunit alpha [Syntrophomonas sp.]HRW12034.1 L-serine ammonia-lyase, iron-sulfur-dependent, subunit alpha [Syntrophomonas sp.]